jgi:hypothetical protein
MFPRAGDVVRGAGDDLHALVNARQMSGSAHAFVRVASL